MRVLAPLFTLFWLLISSAQAAPSLPSVEVMAGAMIMTGFQGVSVPAPFLEAVRKGHVGGVILFDRDMTSGSSRNITSPAQLAHLTTTLQAQAPRPLLIAVDQEGGHVRRLKPAQGFASLPSAQEMSSLSEAEIFRLGQKAGREMARAGINVDLAPVVDVHVSRQSPGLGDLGRMFGSNAAAVSRLALAFAAGLEKSGVIPVLKHFPGLGSASLDSHRDLPDISKTWRQSELFPYSEAFQQGWKGMVLVAHVYHSGLDRERPASLSPKIIEGLLRERLGWQGVVISDDLQMGAVNKGYSLEKIVRLAIEAGNDILLFGNNLQYDPALHEKVFRILIGLVHQGVIPVQRLERSWRRIEALKTRLGACGPELPVSSLE